MPEIPPTRFWSVSARIRNAEAAQEATLKRAQLSTGSLSTPVETGCKEEPAKARLRGPCSRGIPGRTPSPYDRLPLSRALHNSDLFVRQFVEFADEMIDFLIRGGDLPFEDPRLFQSSAFAAIILLKRLSAHVNEKRFQDLESQGHSLLL